jgi:UDP-3-O-[3-hydroxymyristoyl] N-acetylglucosamine deacetylase/3-hydroxyacyl-[acyl-carrier-protein] dehydratase
VVIVDRELSPSGLKELMKKLGIVESVVLGENGILNNTKLRFNNEPARHKVVDLIGDLALIGAPIKGHIMAARPGHKHNIEFVKILRKLYEQNKLKLKSGLKTGLKPNGKMDVVLDINAIKKMLPHRYPMLMVDKVVYLEAGKRIIGVKNVTINEPFFQGHFPSKPVMPGVLIVEAMAQTGGLLLLQFFDNPENKLAYFVTIDKAKFRKQVIPGDQLFFDVEVTDRKRNIFKLKGKAYRNSIDGELCAEAELMCAISDE